MKTHLLSSVLLAIFATTSAIAAQPAESIVLREGLDGYSGVSDTTVINSADHKEKNFGGMTSILVGYPTFGHREGLLRFDLSAFAGRTVDGGAVLRLTQFNQGSGSGTFTVSLYQILAANADWIEGSGVDAPATLGEPSWDFKAKGTTENTLWAGAPGLAQAGVDYLSTPVATITYDTANNGGDVLINISGELIQFWIDNPSANGGLLLIGARGENNQLLGGFRSSEYGASGNSARPELSFSLVNVPESSTYALSFGVIAVIAVALVRRKR